jgi:hypothetical protein
MQHTLAKWNVDKEPGTQIHIKVSINSGEVTVTETDVFGDPVNVAAKIEKATNPDEIYFTESVFLAMVKAEVPTSFVKTFRPKGAESQEIKLYRVAQDEGDERYQKIIASTHIDVDKVKTRVMELSTVAEREFNRYQDTLEELVKAQGKSSRGVISAVIAAALILAIAIIVGFSMFKTSDEERVIEAVNAFLANDKPEDARKQLEDYIDTNGETDKITQALQTVRVYEINRATEKAEEFLVTGRPGDALAELESALGKDKAESKQQELMDRSTAFVAAIDSLEKGDVKLALEHATKAQSSASPNEHIDNIIDRAKVLMNVRDVLENADAVKKQAPSLIDQVANTFGEDTDNPHALDALKRLLILHLYWTARGNTKTKEQASAMLDEYRSRFTRIPDWTEMSREVALGGLWDYTASYVENKKWQSGNDKDGFINHRAELRGYGKDDNEFNYRFAREMHLVNNELSLTYYTTPGMWEMEKVLAADPSMIQSRKDELIEMCKVWFLKTNYGDTLLRTLVIEHYYSDMREFVQDQLHATKSWGDRDPEPNTSPRNNAFVICAARSDFEAIKDPRGYLEENMKWIAQTNWDEKTPRISRTDVQGFFAMPMEEQTFLDMREFLSNAKKDCEERVKWNSTYARKNIPVMLEDFDAAHPEYAGSND